MGRVVRVGQLKESFVIQSYAQKCLDTEKGLWQWHEPATQILTQSHVSMSSAGIRLDPVVQRYAWPSELDLMARIAGLRLEQRWGGWEQEPFDSSSDLHVSVYSR